MVPEVRVPSADFPTDHFDKMYFGQALIAQAQPILKFEKLGQKVPLGHFWIRSRIPTPPLTYVELHVTMPDSSKDEYLRSCERYLLGKIPIGLAKLYM